MDWAGLIESLGAIPTASALKVHLEAAMREMEELKRKVTALETEKAELLRENGDQKKRLEELTQKNKTVSIGPCLIKFDNKGEVLPGFYCLTCEGAFSKITYKAKPILHCGKCDTILDQNEATRALRQYRREAEGET